MAQEGIHPNQYELTIFMTNGESFSTKSTSNMGKLILDSDINTHPAWNGGMFQVNKKVGKVSQFNNKFGDLF